MSTQKRGRFFLGIGAVVLPMVSFMIGVEASDQALKTMPFALAAATIATLMALTLAGLACWAAGLAPWDEP